MELVDAHRAVVRVRDARRDIHAVAPVVRAHAHDRRGGGRHLGLAGHRVGLHDPGARSCEELELVDRAGLEVGDEELPDPGGPHAPHAWPAPSQRLNSPTTRTLGRGAQTVNAVPRTAPVAPVLAVVRAEHMPELFVASLADEVQVELADRGREPVRVVARPLVVAVDARIR